MSTNKTYRWVFPSLATLIFVVAVLIGLPERASAAPSFDEITNSCLTCHEDLYYLHDSGKYYCVTEQKDRCVNCHAGSENLIIKEQAHFGLIVHPQENEGMKCQECHSEDVQARLDTFATLGGYSTLIIAETYTPPVAIEVGFPDVPKPNSIVENGLFSVGAIVIFGFWLILVHFSHSKP
jgi:hypothetical protein